jgi:hypothetical protein
MSEPPKSVILNQHSVTIEVDGRSITGTYSVWAGTITVSTQLGSKARQVGGSGSQRALEPGVPAVSAPS